MNQIWLNAVKATGAFVFAGAYDSIPLVHLYEPARRGLISYTGSLVRIRRSSDNTEQDFGYTGSGNLDTAAITTFLGGSNGFIVTVYDQVGTDNLTQATASAQPAYVASGQGGRPIMRYDGVNDRLQIAFSALSRPYHYYIGTSLDAVSVNTGDLVLFDSNDGANLNRFQQWSTTPNWWMVYGGAVLSDSNTNSNANLFTVYWDSGASSDLRANGSSIASGNAGTINAGGITIGALYDGSFAWDGDIYMVAIADPSHGTTDRDAMETAINNYWSIY